jgi:hypothetical protein
METGCDFTILMPQDMENAVPIYVEAIEIMHELEIPFVVIGGIAMLEYGRKRVTKDLDFLVYEQDAIKLLEVLPTYGYRTQRTDDNWVYHAFKGGQIIDLLFALGKGFLGDPVGVVLNDELVAWSKKACLGGQEFLVISPEDMIHSKLLVSWKVERQEDFQDMLLIIQNAKQLDWDRLMSIILRYPTRSLALLSYAVSYQATEESIPPHIVDKVESLSRSLTDCVERAA